MMGNSITTESLPGSPRLRVVLVEDNAGDARLVREALRANPSADCQLSHVTRLSEACELFARSAPDVVLLDLGLPDAEGLPLVSELVRRFPDLPIVVLTGRRDEALAAQAVREGASDYLVKGDIDGPILTRAIRYAVERHVLIADIRRHNRQLEEFAFATAHDLKAPLCGVEQGIEYLFYATEKAALPAAVSDGLTEIRMASNRMRRLVTDLLVLGRAGSSAGGLERVATRDLVDQVAQRYASELRARGIAFERSDDLPHVYARQRDVEAILDNLIGNAIKYMGSQSNPRITVASCSSRDRVEICVRDNGTGFDPVFAEKAFEPYFRLSMDNEGTGLGLAIVKKAVDGHGGRVWIDTAPGAGTAVYFSLPIDDEGGERNGEATNNAA